MLAAAPRLSTFLPRNSLFWQTLCYHLHTMKIEESRMAAVLRPGVKKLAGMFSEHGYEVRIAGGAVRDLLLGKVPHDLDFATTATPEQMKSIFETEGVRMINAGGEKHGTVTVRLEDENYECTTLRIDLVTDGRHATVQFTQDWELDANRRDLTINAMFLGLDGTVYDYFNGSKHLQDRFVTFVGDADKRIKEDYLRILRYFRFYGRIAEGPDNHSPEVLESIKKNVEGLGKISGERIWVELQKIITGNYGGDLLIKMVECGLNPYIGFPENLDCDNVRCVYKRCEEANIQVKEMHHMTLLASGLSSEEECIKLIARIKCSKREQEILLHIIKYRDFAMQATSLKEIKDLLVDLVIGEKRNKDVALFYVSEILKYTCRIEYRNALQDWNLPRFPVNGNMIGEKGIPRKKTKFVLNDLLEEWKKSDFSLSAKDLLDTLDIERYQ
ncbi:CCA tRNA nucleotidyltransferase 1, mitochondrial-like [Homarus americanus]|uniref:CCA tRNA nucleotidyltransferase 1-like n=1 Tax=Homarus americanus TaxID=6706 RepID=A0A8J5JKR0_HOMAM|nr:CCA tRNA nucleotidyltransferase 1, mitochondrial-like [Homarus americanus]KAG7159241.1 CCA tRNA nucleotidyltransferase 1-like [Homarus americanus]